MSTLNAAPTWLVMLVVLILVLAAYEFGGRLARTRWSAGVSPEPAMAVQAAAYTMLGLLLGFSFSLGLSRFDARRTVLIDEANAIGTTYLRTDLLDPRTASALRADLRRYVDERIDFALAATDPTQRTLVAARSRRLQEDMWALAMAASRRDPHSTMTPLFVSALNETIDLSTEQGAVLDAHIPDIVFFALVLIMLIAASMLGYGFGLQGRRAVVSKVLLALTLALVIGLILDLDRPQRGLIRVNLEPLQTLQRSFSRPQSPA
jgi:hypothetical protein